MKEKIIIYGAGSDGKKALRCLKDDYEVLFFVDTDESKWGTTIEEFVINAPEILNDYCDVKLVIASSYKEEILAQIKNVKTSKIEVFQGGLERCLSGEVVTQLDRRTINWGSFFKDDTVMTGKELTFMAGGSGILDYFFRKQLASQLKCNSYMEIGTYIGESINILTDVCEDLYSLTAPLDAPYSMRNWCKKYKLPDYSERLTYSSKIKHFYADSKEFDYTLIPKDIDLFFIDGDHSYAGVYSDTQNIFKIKKESAIVVWYDFKKQRNVYNADVVQAVKDVLGKAFSDVYVSDNNLCGVYLPEQYKERFALCENKYDEERPLYVYDAELVVHIKSKSCTDGR